MLEVKLIRNECSTNGIVLKEARFISISYYENLTGRSRVKQILFFIVTIIVVGCSAHNPLIIKDTTETIKSTQNKYPAHSDPIYITEEIPPAKLDYEILEQIEIGKVWYGDKGDIEESIATRAQQIGADAVIDFKTWHQPSGWSWAAPHGSGKAIKLSEKTPTSLAGLKGTWKEMKTKPPVLNQAKNDRRIENQETITEFDSLTTPISNSITSGNYNLARDLSIQLHEEDSPSQDTLDLIAQLIWEQRESTDDTLADALSYLCKVIGKSKSPRYRLIMEAIRNESQTRKLKRYAQKCLRSIPVDATTEQYSPGNRMRLAKTKENFDSVVVPQ